MNTERACATITTTAARHGCLSADLLADIDGIDLEASLAEVERIVAAVAPCARWQSGELIACLEHADLVADELLPGEPRPLRFFLDLGA